MPSRNKSTRTPRRTRQRPPVDGVLGETSDLGDGTVAAKPGDDVDGGTKHAADFVEISKNPQADFEDFRNDHARNSSNDPGMAENPLQTAWRQLLNEWLRQVKKQWPPSKIEAKLGLPGTTISQMRRTSKKNLKKPRNIKYEELVAIGEIIGRTVPPELDPRVTITLPITGRIVSDQRIASLEGSHWQDVQVPVPDARVAGMNALVVDGASMKPHYNDGDVIYYDDTKESPTPDHVGAALICETEGGESYFRFLEFGSQPGFWTLMSADPNTPAIRDVKLAWVTPWVCHYRYRRQT